MNQQSPLNPADLLGDADLKLFEPYLGHPEEVLMEMASMRGKDAQKAEGLPFSFFLSDRGAVHNSRGIRVRILWNPSRAPHEAENILNEGLRMRTAGTVEIA